MTTMGQEAPVRLPHSGCEVRIGRGSRGRPAFEVAIDHEPYDVAVAGSLGSGLLRGALRGRRAGRAWSVAWGELPADGGPVSAVFRPGRFSRTPALPVPVRVVGDRFWIAEAQGDFRSVAVLSSSAEARARLARH